ncbi:hypothetical protein MNV49_002891 [Pseudohyphozyma bogoriensis]|nr:hypothetical protein MNV49_002891 [Pseudohyphozyma bogoriensis]
MPPPTLYTDEYGDQYPILQKAVAWRGGEGIQDRKFMWCELMATIETSSLLETYSEYVVKGITEWFPRWKRNGWLNSNNKTPTNLNLFQKLDRIVSGLEGGGRKVGFWHVERRYNKVADGLANAGAREAQPRPQTQPIVVTTGYAEVIGDPNHLNLY